MPDTFQAVAILAIALLPGALYVWAFERQAGRWGVGLSDRLPRFVGGSAIFHAAVAPLTYWLWAEHRTTASNGSPVSWWLWLWLWLLVIAYVAAPVVGGTAVGLGVRHRKRWSTLFAGPHPAPRAWDHLFSQPVDG